MISLVRLYPREWRDRYEPEFLEVLASRPLSAGDRLDIMRGAIDARRNPEVPGAPTRPPRPMRPARVAGVSALVAGGAFLAWSALILLEFRGWDEEEPEHAGLGILLSAVTGLALAVAHAAIGLSSDASMRRFGGPAASVAAVCFALGALGGGALVAWGLVASVVLGAAVAGRTIPMAMAAVWAVTTVVAVTAMLAFVAGNGRDTALLAWLPPLGVSWILVGALVTARGVPALAPKPDTAGSG